MSAAFTEMPAENTEVSVIILTKNSAGTIEACLRSVVRENPGEILAVDAYSSDNTPVILRRYGVRILLDPAGSLGLSRQLAVEAAGGRYVMFVDSDVELTDGCITKLRSDLEKHGWVGVHARILSRENATYCQRAEDASCSLINKVGPTRQIDTIAALFRRDVLLTHPFDPSLRESSEERDLCRRLVQSKYSLGVSDAVAYHHHRREFSAFVRHRFRYGLGDARYGLKYGEIRALVDPLVLPLWQIKVTKKIRFVPYFVAGGLAQFLGVVAGLSSARRRNADFH